MCHDQYTNTKAYGIGRMLRVTLSCPACKDEEEEDDDEEEEEDEDGAIQSDQSSGTAGRCCTVRLCSCRSQEDEEEEDEKPKSKKDSKRSSRSEGKGDSPILRWSCGQVEGVPCHPV